MHFKMSNTKASIDSKSVIDARYGVVDGTCFCILLSLARSNRSQLGMQKPGR